MPRVCAFRTRARDLLSRQDVDDGTLADIVPTEDGEVLEAIVRDQPANAIPEEGVREEKGAREAVHVVPAPEQLLRCLGLGFAGQEAGPRIGAVQGIKIAHEMREQLLLRHSLISLRPGAISTACRGALSYTTSQGGTCWHPCAWPRASSPICPAYQTGDALARPRQSSLGTRSTGAVRVPTRARPLRGDAAVNGVHTLAGEANKCKS